MRNISPSEHDETAAVVRFWDVACRRYGRPREALIHIPNEGHRSPVTAARLKAEGMRPGIPDLFLAVPNNGKAGLWIEMKRAKGGRLSDNQESMLYMLDYLGYAAMVAHGSIEAVNAIKEYLR